MRASAQTAGTCTGGSATTDLDIGGVRARLYNNGGLFWKGAGNVYNVPKVPAGYPNTPNALFTAGLWVGGYVDGELRQAAASFSNWEFYPGPPLADGSGPSVCTHYDRIWTVTADEMRTYDQTGIATRDLLEWPFANGAPVRDGDGFPGNYNLAGGDRPDIQGHQIAFWVMNDAGGPHNRTGSKPLGLEVRVTAMAFRSPSEALDHSTAYRYEIINRTATPITEAYLGLWADPDLGNASDDLVGSDPLLQLGYVYNADNVDEGGDGYGSPPPAFGFSFLDGSLRPDGGRGFTSFVNPVKGSCGRECEPTANSSDYYRLASGRWKDGALPYACGDGYSAQFAGCGTARWMYPGNPAAPPRQRFWSKLETTPGGAAISATDQYFVLGAGPYTFAPGVPVTLTFAGVWARGADHLDSVTRLKAATREVQATYSATGFRGLPMRSRQLLAEAPRLVSPASGVGGQPTDVTLQWDALPGAPSYALSLAGASEPLPAPGMLVSGPSARVTLSPGPYVWRVAAVNDDGRGPWSEVQRFTVGEATFTLGGFTRFALTRNAAGPLDPPEMGAMDPNHRGFPRVGVAPGDQTVGRAQATNAARWGLHALNTSATDGGFAEFEARTLPDLGHLLALEGHAYELRFTATGGKALVTFDGSTPTLIDVPFELWDAGLLADASDDVRMIPFLEPVPGGQRTRFDVGADHPTSGGNDDPQTDAIYWRRPTDRHAGAAGYQAWVTAALAGRPEGAEVGPEVFARTVLVNWNGGPTPAGPFNAALPETGSVFRLETNAPQAAPILAAPASGAQVPGTRATLAWQEIDAPIVRRFVEVATDSAFTRIIVRDSSATQARFTTPALASGQRYYWRVRLRVTLAGSASDYLTGWSRTGSFIVGTASGVERAEALPVVLTLRSLAPNPTHGPVQLGYGLPEADAVRVRLYDLLGREAATWALGPQGAGWHQAPLNTNTLPAGVYVVRLEAGGAALTRSLVVVR